MQNVDYERGVHANDWVREKFPVDAGKAIVDSGKKYRSVVSSSLVDLRQTGLLQLAAFWLSKGDRECEILCLLLNWLGKSGVTRGICAAGPDNREAIIAVSNNPNDCVAPLLQRTSIEIALLESEAAAYMVWLRRLIEGRWKVWEAQKKNKDEEKRKREAASQAQEEATHE